MQVFIHKDRNASSEALKDMVKKRLPSPIIYEQDIDFSPAPWEEYKNNLKGIAKKWLYKQIDKLSDYFQNTLDFYFALVLTKNWKERSVLGWHHGRSYRNARISLIRHRNNYEDTVDHELVHGVWRYIYIHTGIKLEYILGVSEEGVAHGTVDGYEEYDYDWFWNEIESILQLAHGEDMADEYRGLLKLTIRKAQMLIRKLKS